MLFNHKFSFPGHNRLSQIMNAPSFRARENKPHAMTTRHQPSNKRKAVRKRTRLRSGKTATLQNRFISDCLIFDRSPLGVRVRLAERTHLPEHVKFFDDELETLHVARVVWQRNNEVGLVFTKGTDGGQKSGPAHAAFTGKYYALRRV